MFLDVLELSLLMAYMVLPFLTLKTSPEMKTISVNIQVSNIKKSRN